jgi:hypothetical protein
MEKNDIFEKPSYTFDIDDHSTDETADDESVGKYWQLQVT